MTDIKYSIRFYFRPYFCSFLLYRKDMSHVGIPMSQELYVAHFFCQSIILHELDVHGSMHCNINLIERTNKTRLCIRIYYSIVS
jgi:hypothetical protein